MEPIDESQPRMIAVPVKLAMEAVRRKKRETQAAPRPVRRTVAIPFHKIRSPAEAHTYARIMIAKERAAGHDMSDRSTAQDAAAAAEAILRHQQNNFDLHLNTVGREKRLLARTDVSITPTEHWTALNQEFRELTAEAGQYHEPDLSHGVAEPAPLPPRIHPNLALRQEMDRDRELHSAGPPPPRTHKECTYCHILCAVAAKFCQNCGSPLLGVAASAAAPPGGAYAPRADPSVSSRGGGGGATPQAALPSPGIPYNTPASTAARLPAPIQTSSYPAATHDSAAPSLPGSISQGEPTPLVQPVSKGRSASGQPASQPASRQATSVPGSALPSKGVSTVQPVSEGAVPSKAASSVPPGSVVSAVPPSVVVRDDDVVDPAVAEAGSPASKKNTAIDPNDAPPSGFFTTPGSVPVQ